MEKNEPRSPAFERIRAINREVSYNGKKLDQSDLEQYIPARQINASIREDALSLLCDSLEKPITSDLVERLIRLGVARPAWIEVQQWESMAPISEEEKIIVMLSAFGMTEEEIGNELGMKKSKVKYFLSYKRNQEKIYELQEKHLMKVNPRKFIEKVIPEAVKTVYEVMTDKRVKASTRLAAAESFIDRVWGKATQKVEVEDSTIRDVLMKIDQINALQKQEDDKKTIEMKKEEGACQSEADPIETWVEQNKL